MTREELQAIRKSHKLTLAAFGKILGYNANYISRLENGTEKKPPNITKRFERLVLEMFPPRKERKVKETS
jgi:transcriptional regulator with XRE-family HTH domain